MPLPLQTRLIRFGVFEADLQSGELRKEGVKIGLNRQSFQLLAVLIEHAGEVVTREQLKARLWGSDTFVDFDVGLNTAMKKLRAALGDSTEAPRYVETLPRKGYRFIGSITLVTEPAARPRRFNRWLVWATACVLLAAVVAGIMLDRARGATDHIRSIAVLPLDNLTGDPSEESFVDGVTDALTTDLAQMTSLRVIPRTSTMRYKHTQERLEQIGKELSVDAIVEGTVVRSPERVRVNAQLVQPGSDRSLWAGTYERPLGDVVTLQSEIARAVADAIQVQLTPQNAVVARRQSVDPQAYESYLRGRYFLDKWTDGGCRKAIEYFQEAIQRDPHYALAYAGLAEAFLLRRDIPPREAFPKAKEMARAALQIDPGLPEAHNALGMSIFLYDWNFIAAEREFRRALAIDPNYAMAHQFYGQLQKALGRPNWAAEVRRAHQLQPLTIVIAGSGQFRASGRNDLAIDFMRKKIELEPDSPDLYGQLGDTYARLGKYPEAEEQYVKGFELSDGSPNCLAHLGYTYALEGKRAEAMKLLDRLAVLSKRTYVSAYDVALVYVGLGEKDAAFDWLQNAMAERATQLVFLNWNEQLASLRSDARYAELVRQVGLPR